MFRPPRHAAFTLIEMITVIAIIALLAGLVLAVNGLVQQKSARSRADAEIRMLSTAIESYKNDNGGYPESNTSDTLDARAVSDPMKYASASQFLYGELTGDTKFTGMASNMTKNYAPDFWKPSRLGGFKTNGVVTYIQDPFGNSYGYSTIGLAAEQTYRAQLAANPANTARPNAANPQGYNPTFDLWSTCGDASVPANVAKWAKNW